MTPEWDELPADLRKVAEPARQAVFEGRDVVLIGPPGSGKTMVARRLRRNPEVVDTLVSDSLIVHRLAGTINSNQRVWHPFRAPHYTASDIAMLGGGRIGHPGEVSLAHGGILFLDEAQEFKSYTLEAVALAHKNRVVTFGDRSPWIRALPADFVIVAACNPCPCGYYGSAQRDCVCTAKMRERYTSRIAPLGLTDAVTVHFE